VKRITKGLKVLLLTVLAYLVQVCVMDYLKISGISGSVVFSVIAVFTVSLGKKYTFCASCIIGMMMESMVSNVPALYVIAYPVISMLAAQAFADMNYRQRERRRAALDEKKNNQLGKKRFQAKLLNRIAQARATGLGPHIRILCCAGLMDILMNIVLSVYMYLIGVEFSFYQIWKVLVSLAYTEGICLVLMIPLRCWLGVDQRFARKNRGGDIL